MRWRGIFILTGPIIPGKLGVQIWGDASARQEDHVLDGVARHKKLNGTTRLWFTPVEGQEFMLGITEQEQTFNTTGGKTLAPDADSKETIYDRTQYDFSYAGNILSGRMEFDAYREEISSEGTQSGRPEVPTPRWKAPITCRWATISCLSAGSTKRESSRIRGIIPPLPRMVRSRIRRLPWKNFQPSSRTNGGCWTTSA